jgi:ribosomal protein L19
LENVFIMANMIDKVKDIRQELLKTVDVNLGCSIGKVYRVTYTNLENNNKFRQFFGICIKKKFIKGEIRVVLRNFIGGVGVEIGFGGLSPEIVRTIDTKIFKGVYRKAKLYYLRRKGISASTVKYRGAGGTNKKKV